MKTVLFRVASATAVIALSACGAEHAVPGGQPRAMDTGPLVSAHRGGAAYAPENTLMAFDNAVRLGVDELEMDAQLTVDGELVVIHDDTLDRTTDCSGAVSAATLDMIRNCDAAYWFAPGQGTTSPKDDVDHPLRGLGIRVPTLRELLEWYTAGQVRQRLSIEIKNIPGEANFDPLGQNTAAVLVPLLQEFGVTGNVVIQSFWPMSLDAVRQLDSSIRTQYLTTSETGQTALFGLGYATSSGYEITAPNFDAPDFDATVVDLAHQAGKLIVPWTVDHADDQQTIFGYGVDGLISNYPECALEWLGRSQVEQATPAGVPSIPACP